MSIRLAFYPESFDPFFSTKAYPTLDLQNANFVNALGNVCSAVRRLPTCAILSAELEKCGNVPYASRAFADMWQGKSRSTQVSIKALRFHSAQVTEETKEVSRHST